MLSLILLGLNNWIFKTLTLSEVLMVSSVLCATDTVAAMSLIKVQYAVTYSPKNIQYLTQYFSDKE